MSDEDKLSEDELDALISDLENRSEGGGGASADLEAEGPEGPDIEELMKEVDQEAPEVSAESKVAEPDSEAGPDLSELQVADELPTETGGTAPESASRDGGQKQTAEAPSGQGATESEASAVDAAEADPATGGGSTESKRIWRYIWVATKWTGYALPVIAFWWVLGSYLGQWISAGWLIALVSTMFVLGVPKFLYDLADRRGKFRWWLAGASLVLTVALVAPLTESAGEALTYYGHWPATSVAEISGAPGGFLVEANAAAGDAVGRALHPDLPASAGRHQLGQ